MIAFLAKMYGRKFIAHSHSTSNGNGFSSIVKKIFQYPIRFFSDYFMACSIQSGEWLFGHNVVKSNRFFLINNAINTELYRFNGILRKDVRQEFNIDDKCLSIITIGRIEAPKNPYVLVEICKRLKQINSKWKLLWVGGGAKQKEINEIIKNEKLDTSVILTGLRRDVPRLLQGADLFILPSLWEGIPVVAIEAQASGIPCLLSDVISDSIDITGLCTFLPPDNISAWVETILQNIGRNRKDTRASIIESGYDVCTTAKWLIEFYSNLNP